MFAKYKRKGLTEARPYVLNEDLTHISVAAVDRVNGSPRAGDMVARNPKNHDDQWLIAAQYFADNLEPAEVQ